MEAIPLPTVHSLLALAAGATSLDYFRHPERPATCVRRYHFARWALADAVRSLTTSVRKRAWLPAYICEEATVGLRAAGIEVRFYPVGRSLRPQLSDLPIVDPDADIFVFVHYFGWSPHLDEARAFCHDRGLRWIEDAAHCLRPTSTIGRYADAVVYSSRKLLPLCGGAVLCMSNPGDEFTGPRVSLRRELQTLGGLLARRVLSSARVPYREIKVRLRADAPRDHSRTTAEENGRGAMGRLSHHQLAAFRTGDLDAVVVARRDNYRALERLVAGIPGVQSLFPDLRDEVCPFAYPVLLPDREAAVGRFRSHGIAVQRWPKLPRDIISGPPEYRDARDLADRVLLLPVHQDLSRRDTTRIARILAGLRH